MRLRLFAAMLSCAFVWGAERYEVVERDGLIVLSDHEAGVEATIAPKEGGELCGLKYKFQDKWVELLYRACEYAPAEGWRGKAPLLWPATGRADAYQVKGKTYEVPFHGFAMKMPWKVDVAKAGKSEARALLSLRATEETKKIYPFEWRLTVEYRLREGRLFMVYDVGASKQNTSNMFFSIGNHITFRAPFVPGSDAGKLTMETAAGAYLKKDAKSLPTGETTPSPFSGRVMLQNVEALKAHSLGAYRTDPSIVLRDPAGLQLRMKHSASKLPAQPLVQFNLWGDPKAGYFSPEPWVGGQNSFHNKIGLVELKPAEGWTWTIEIQPMAYARM